MKIKIVPLLILLACIFFKGFSSFGQLTGIKTIPGDYVSIASAVAALNVSGPGTGGVTFNVVAGYTETISATISLTATGTLANPVIFQKDPATSGANPLLTSYTTGTGTPSTAVQDGIWRLVGADYITINGIDALDNPANTTPPSTMEYGYALYKASTAKGCQNVTIKNCVITLRNSNNATGTAPMTAGSAGIIVMNALPATATTSVSPVAGGTNSNNKFYGNTIQQCNIGISIIGYGAASPFTLSDTNNDIGGSTVATGNTIINFGGASGAINAAAAIHTQAQQGLNVSYNTINNNNGSGTNHSNTLRGIYITSATSANATITYNTVTLKGGGTTQHVMGIENTSGSTAAGNSIIISNNTITNSTYNSATTGGFYGIYNNGASPATLTINSNTISNNSSAAGTSGFFYGILNSGLASAVTMSSNTVSGNSTGNLTTGLFASIYNSASVPSLTINGNTIAGNTSSALSGLYYPIYNSGTVTTTININSNNIGTAISPAINFTAANSGSQQFIRNSKGGAGAALSISNNNFYNVLYSIQGTGTNIYISNAAATLSQAINGNTFTNLSVNTKGSITFISNSVIVPATGTQNVNNNTISGTFAKTGDGGTLTLFTSSVASVAGSVINNNNNNFSNITVIGATTIAGWVNTDAGNSTKTIQNNTFSNWVGGTGNVVAMAVNITSPYSTTTANTIHTISGALNVYGITTAAGNDKIYSNTIHTLISTGAAGTVTAIYVTLGTTKNIYQNTIYNLQGNGVTTGSVRGIVIIGGTTVNVYQNTIYSLQANTLTTGTLNGIWVSGGTTIAVYRNKIYDLSSSSNSITGYVNGIQVSGTTVNRTVTLQNNLVGDLRTPSANSADAIRGISLVATGATSTTKVYNNTIYLNGVSSGTNFGSTGIYHTTSSTATTATLDLRNNIISNTSVPNGTGLTVAYRRSSTTLTNYHAASNNNLFYAGLAAGNRLIYNGSGTNSDQLLSTYKARVSPRDAQSFTEDMIVTSTFLSTIGSSASFLHLDPSKITQAESGAAGITGVTTDFDGEIRQGNTGYAGSGTAPDIGADEADATPSPALSGTYNVGAGEIFTSLTNAGGLFAGINSRGLSGNVVVNITTDLPGEDGTNVLYQWVEQGVGNYSLTIKPDVSTARIISGNVLAGMIRLSGAKRVIIDGSNGTTSNYLTFRNTNTPATTGTAFTFINGASNNIIKYCTVEAFANSTNGVILFGTSGVAGGNSNNTITNCNINATVSSNTGNLCIYSSGTVGNENSTNTIANNAIFNYSDRALDITNTGSTGWVITGNSFYNGTVSASINYASASALHGIRIAGGTGYLISNNYLGGNAALSGGTSAAYASSLGNVSYQGIVLTTSGPTPASTIKGNTIANITLSSVPTVSGSIAFSGIETSGSGINIGGVLPGDGNSIGSNTANSLVNVTTTTGTSTFTTTIRGISCGSTGGLVIGNQVGGIDIRNIGAAPAPSTFIGIYISNPTAPSQVNNNIIGSTGTGAAANSIQVLSSSTATATAITGISIASTVVSAVQVDGNIIQNLSHLGLVNTISGGIIGISNASTGASAITITNNTVTILSFATYSSGVFYGIYNFGVCSSISINSNTINGNTTASTSGAYFAIYNSAAVTTAININSNNIGNSTTGAFNFTAANSGTQNFINNIAGAATAALSISNNNFQGINYAVAGTGANTYIQNTGATLSQAINGNTFTNLNVNTSGNITFIANNVVMPASGTQNVNNNAIVTAFTKRAGGTVTLFTSSATSVAGSIINNNNNDFSNITVLAATTIAGWVNTDAGAPTKTIQNNIFSNWVGGTSSITAMSVNISGTSNATTGNLINNISGAGSVTGITSAAGDDNIYSNTINSLASTGAFVVTAIAVNAGTTKNIYKNKIYGISGSNASGTVNGILVSGGTTVNIYNNLIGDLRTPAANTSDAIRGISVTSVSASSVTNVYYNTVYLNGTSSGATFGTSGIYHVASGTATTGALNLRNNIIGNTSTPNGSGKTVAYRRSGTALNNYASTSNNNLFYAGTPAASKLIFTDGTNSDQTLANYQTRVAAIDALSVTEDITSKFLSVTGTSSVFLHIIDTIPTQIESGAVNIPGITDDFDGQIRAGNPGYTGPPSSSPDIGADGIFGIEIDPPTITYSVLGNTTSTANRNITGVDITDGSGVNIAAGTKPRIYYKRFSAANTLLDNSPGSNGWKYTEATNATSPFTFTINYALLFGGATVTAGAIQYFIVAQDIATSANVAINSGTFANTPSSVALTAAAFPIGGTINSYTIPFTGAYNVGTGEVFTSLTNANGLFAAINSAGMAGNTTFNIVSDLSEDGTNALNQWTESGAGNYTLTIQPNAATVRTISGNVPAGLIRLDGADRVMINGSISGSGSYLTFRNTNTSVLTGTAVTFLNGATNNTLKYCNIRASADAANGTILFGGSAVTGGNSNNLVDNCIISATVAANTGKVAIYSAGTVGNENAANTISNNSINNYRDRGLDITATGSAGWTISANSFYNGDVTGTHNYTFSSTLHGIKISGGSGYSVLNNYIGGNAALASGSNAVYASTLGDISFQGILLTTTSASPVSNIKGNTIAAISLSSVPTGANSSAFTGIETNGAGINIGGNAAGDGNQVGSAGNIGSVSITTSTLSTANSSLITGIHCGSTGGTISGNQVGGFDINNIGSAPAPSSFTGLFINSASAPSTVTNNTIGSATTSNSIRVLSTSSATTTALTGISVGSLVNSNILLNGNRIENIAHLSLTSSGNFTGINNAASSGVLTITNDTILNIITAANANSGSTAYTGISSGATSIITNNLISSIALNSSGTNAQITGIAVSGAFVQTITGNIVSGLTTASAKTSGSVETSSPAGATITGILNTATIAGQVISNNTLYNFNAVNTAAINTVVTGIGITASLTGNIFNNRISGFTNKSTGSNPGICGVVAASGSFNLYNNSVRLDNSSNVNGVKIYGIIHAAGNNWNYFHNSVSIAGNATGAALRSASFIRPVDGDLLLRNNVFINTRTGTGTHYAVSNIVTPANSTWPAAASNYNDLYSSNAATIGEWGLSTNETFAQWKTASGGDANSVSTPVSFTASLYDLQSDSLSNCSLNNSGTPITTPIVINTDIKNNARSAISPDMGAYEFNYSVFTILPGSNSPVCAGDSVILSVDPGTALSPSFSWTNPANTVISTIQNPTVAAIAGQYKISITDLNGCRVTDSILVSINQRPTATISAPISLCDSGNVILNLTVTGTGIISGNLSNGDPFSGTAPLIAVTVFVNATSSFSISNMSDAICSSIAIDIPDTVTITVSNKGDWLGITSDWSDPINWCGGILPTSSSDVTIPAATVIMPVILNSVQCRNLFISTGDTLTITAAGTLNIYGIITNNGVYNDNGTTNFNGNTGQQTFSGITTFNNLTLNNAGGLLLPVAIIVKNNLLISLGALNANNFNISLKGNWTNNVSASSFTGGTATVTFNSATVQSIGGTFATSFNNLVIANTAATVTLNVNASITGDLSISSGTFDMAGFTANRATAGGTLTVSNNATLKIGGTNTYPTNYTTSTLVVAGTVEYSGTNQTVANKVYGNLKLSSASGAAIKTFPATALTVVGNLSSTLGTGTSVSFTAASNITVSGNVTIGASTTFDGGSYSHPIGGNWTNSGTFTGNTGTIIFTGPGTVVGGTGTQNFNNLTVAASAVLFSNNSITLTGSLATTGSGSFSQAPGGTLIMSGVGTTISGSGISLDNFTVSGTVTTSISLNLTGNLAVNGSFIASAATTTMSGTSKTITGAGTISFYIFRASGSVSSNTNFSITNALVVDGSFSASAGTATFTGISSLSGTANLFNATINGVSLQLSAGAVLGIANILTLTSGVLDVTTSGPNTVNFNGAGAQNINSLTYSNLLLSNGSTKTATSDITTIFNITIGSATTFNPAAYTISVYGNWINNGVFIPATSTVQFVGPATAFITGATTFNILTSNTSSSTTELFLQSDVSAAIVNMINGIIQTGANTLTLTNARTGTSYIFGNIRRTHAFTTGVAYAFEGPDNTIDFSAVSGVTSVTVSVVKGPIGDFPFGGSISRVYNITVPAGTYTATLRLHYEDDELNGNDESSMVLWKYNGASWGSAGKTANSTASNYIEQSGLTDITDRWTSSAGSNLVRWNGITSNDWNTASNWTIVQGVPSTPPSSTDIVDLGSATFTNQPTINNTVTVKNIVFGSTKAVVLTLGSSGSLTTLGNINGNWTGNATHTIDVGNQTLTVNGDIDLSDGTTGHAIDLTIGSGTVTTLNSLSERGGANINFSGAGTLNIYKDFLNSSGTFTAGSGTVVYNGTENQAIANVTYNNLTINKAGGLAAINNTVNIAGDLLVSSGQLDNFSTTTIAGNVTINPGDTLTNYQLLHVKGNWNNNGTYFGSSSGTIFDGSGLQTITATTFNNLTINKPSGTALLTGNVTITGDILINSGIFDIQAYAFDRNLPGGTVTTSNGATFMIGADNPPRNFTNNIIAPSSTTIFYGTTPQFIGLAGITFGNLIFRGTGVKTLLAAMTVNGDLTIENLSSFNATSATITLNGNWINSGTFTPSTSTLLCSGTGKTITGNTTFNKVDVTGSYTNISNITYNDLLHITSSGSLSGGGAINTTLNGDLINSGTLYTLGVTTFTGTVLQTLSLINAVQTVAITVNFNGTVSPVLNSTSAPQFGFLNINNTGGVNPSVGWTIAYAMSVGSGASFNGGPSTHNLVGSLTNNGTITSSGVLNFIPSSAATVNLGSNFSSTGRVNFGGAGAMTIAGSPSSFFNVVASNTNLSGITPSSNWNILNNFTINSSSILKAGNYTYLVGGNISNSGTITSGTSTFTLNGAGIQDIYTLSAFNNLTSNKPAGSTTMSSDVQVNGVLNFIAGQIQTGSKILIQPSSGTVTGAAQSTGWVNGNLQKSIATGTNVSSTFEIGGNTGYTPATVLFAGVTVSGNLTANTVSAEHPQIKQSAIDSSYDVTRYWLLTNTGIGFTTANATFNWVTTDVDAGAITANFKPGLYDGVSWTTPLFASPLPLSIQATGLTSFGDFAIGDGFKVTTWTGAAGTADWFTAGNWYGGVPDITIGTVIPGTLQAGRVFPEINTGTAMVDSLTIENPASLIVTNSTLQIKGPIINNGTFDVSNGTIEMNGVVNQTIPANAFTNSSILNLIINNNVTLAGPGMLTGTLTIGSSGKTFTTNDFLILKSTAASTAAVAPLPVDGAGNPTSYITGNVTVERFIPNKRAWRLLTAPLSTTGSIYNSWQNGGVYEAGKGMLVTGPNPLPANGLDASAFNAVSMKSFNVATQGFINITDTKNTNLSNATGSAANMGYFVFVRGDRNPNNLYAGNSSATTLKSTGTLQTGKQIFTTPAPLNGYSLMVNPYASPVDFNTIQRSHIANLFYTWDAKLNLLGGYVTLLFNTDGTYITSPPGSLQDKNIQSGQAFFVLTDTATAANLTFYESSKSSVSHNAAFRPLNLVKSMEITLNLVEMDGSIIPADGVVAEFGDGYNAGVDHQDAIKFTNINETFSLLRNGVSLAIERRPSIVTIDTLFLKLTQASQRNYQLVFNAGNLSQPTLLAFLEDKYTGISTPVDLQGGTNFNFTINGDPASINATRFRLVFKQSAALPVSFSDVNAWQQGENIAVSWKVENQLNVDRYEVEKSVDGSNFNKVNTQLVVNPNITATTYNWLDLHAVNGDNFYRIRNVDRDGTVAYSKIVKVNIGKGPGGMVIYPNPVTGGVIGLQLKNMAPGRYKIRLLNAIGQALLIKEMTHAGGNASEKITLTNDIAKGLYSLEITDPRKNKTVISVVIQ
ncbi:MAG: hypothetical protein H7Y86_19900 [Rhizobacter sp.]|nr:hypothetical protein [Ferruginibacter sp.]